MIFLSLAKFIKPLLNSEKPILDLLPIWIRKKILENPPLDNAAKIIQAEFTLQEIKTEKVFFITPKSRRAADLMKLMKEYMQVMESTRFARWLEKVQPKDFDRDSSKSVSEKLLE
ncbi:MAG: hypothetical protein ACK481_10290 [Candidatus Melainabacteria bacterium]|jgi:hypothetical protein